MIYGIPTGAEKERAANCRHQDHDDASHHQGCATGSVFQEDGTDGLEVAVFGVNGRGGSGELGEPLLISGPDEQCDPGLEGVILVRRRKARCSGQFGLLLRGFKALGEERRQLLDLLLIESHTAR